MTALAVGSLFTGLGLFDIGFAAAGCDILLQCEIDPYCQEYLQHGHARRYWPNATLVGDAADPSYDWGQWRGRLDIVCGGFPCQPFSQSGERLGEADHRNMWPVFARIIGQVRPRAVVLENVPGICSPYTDDAGVRRPAYALTVVGDLSALGYDAQWGVISAADAGAPHLRDRWWCVAYADGGRRVQPRCLDASEDGHGRMAVSVAQSGQIQRHEIVAGGQTLADAGQSRSFQPGDECRSEGDWERGHASGRDQALADAEGQRLPERRGLRRGLRAQRATAAAQPGLVRPADGSARWLVEPQWPMPQGSAQYAHEPPRVTPRGPRPVEQIRKARVKALGNALIPQIAYALALGAVETLGARSHD